MEFFLPGIAALLIAALLVFLVLPRLGAPVLAILSIVLLIYGVSSHISLFYSEYKNSTWQDRLKSYAPFVMIGALIFMILMYIGYLFGTRGPSALPATNLPTGNSAVVGVVNTVNNTINNIANAVGLGSKKNTKNNSIISNLGAILNTPNKK